MKGVSRYREAIQLWSKVLPRYEILRAMEISVGKSIHEVVIVGAGAAGLACAAALRKAGVSFLVIEARDRIGGRAFSSHSSSGVVVELGAEFIHGAHRETLDLLDRAGEPFLDLCDHHLFYDKGRRREIPDFWERIDRCNGLLNPKLKTDRSIADFIEARGGRWSPDLKKLYISYVEGFQAADIRKAGEKGLARAERGEEPELNSQGQFRPLHGYGAVMEFLKKEASLTEESLHLGSVLKEVRGDQRQIELLVQNAKSPEKRTYRAKKVVLTLPLSVLKTSVVFQPEISELVEALAPMEMGHVQRLTFQFADRFWEKLDDKPVGFLHTGSGDDFPTWWTQMPLRTPFLTAWQGGPKAEEMSSWSEEEKVEKALRTLSVLTRTPFAVLRKKYRAHFTHDWTADPFSRGAYSYMGLSDRRSPNFQKPFRHNVYVAGEAVQKDSSRGTVHGALSSGAAVARSILKTL